MLDKAQGEQVVQAVLKAMKIIAKEASKNANYSQTTRGKITATTSNNTYTVAISNKEYTNVSTLDSKSYKINDIVWCHIPNNQWILMFILGKVS